MTEPRMSFQALRRDHPVFFWGTLGIALLLLIAAGTVAVRIPAYQREAAEIDRRMDEEERSTRDRILEFRTEKSALAVALLQRELRLKAMEEKGLHLAVSTEDSTLYLRMGPATLRRIPVVVGGDSVIRAPDGRTWRFVRALGERHVQEKAVGESYTIPEWAYIASNQPVPAEGRTMEEGLGQYVLRLDDGTEIYSRPDEGPFATGVKPASFVVEDEAGLRAIFDAIKVETPVYIY